MERDKKHSVQVKDITDLVTNSSLRNQTKEWLNGQAPYLQELVQVYVDDPDTFGLHPELKKNPLEIVKTVIQSADKLYEYQEKYDAGLVEIAQANGIEVNNLDDIPLKLQEISLQRERRRVEEQFEESGVVAIGIMGTGASGKGTVGKLSGMQRAVNVTTRPKRPTEIQGKDYLYIREMEPNVADTLEIDSGHNVVGEKDGHKLYETGPDGKPLDYFEKYGPYLTIVHRQGRARHGTPVSQFSELYDKGEKAIFFEHGPVQVKEAGEKLPEHIENAIVVPVCILPPKRGVVPLAVRMAVRTYGDPDHQDKHVEDSYKIEDNYIESTIGFGQIEELRMTSEFVKGDNPLGVAYIVNDKLQDAVDALKSLVQK